MPRNRSNIQNERPTYWLHYVALATMFAGCMTYRYLLVLGVTLIVVSVICESLFIYRAFFRQKTVKPQIAETEDAPPTN